MSVNSPMQPSSTEKESREGWVKIDTIAADKSFSKVEPSSPHQYQPNRYSRVNIKTRSFAPLTRKGCGLLCFRTLLCLFEILNLKVQISVIQVRPGNRRQRRLRLPYGRVHLLPSVPGHQPLLGIVPCHALGGGAHCTGSPDWDVRPPQQATGGYPTSHALQCWGRVDGSGRRVCLRRGLRAERERVRLPG